MDLDRGAPPRLTPPPPLPAAAPPLCQDRRFRPRLSLLGDELCLQEQTAIKTLYHQFVASAEGVESIKWTNKEGIHRIINITWPIETNLSVFE